jgi:hypothetical protein
MWERLDSLLGEINRVWVSSARSSQNLGAIATLLHDVMSSLKRWSQENFGAVTKEIARIRETMENLNLQDPVRNQGRINEVMKRMDEVLYHEEMIWMQRVVFRIATA